MNKKLLEHHYQDLIHLFHECFFTEFNTRLLRGGDEPVYLPAEPKRSYHAIFFAHGFFSSALHECAHWLIAGEARRKLVDFGYWYTPDGRSLEQQALFLHVEVKPQALEWVLSKAAGYKFHISTDNLNGTSSSENNQFKEAVYAQVLDYCKNGLAPRAHKFRQALSSFYNQALTLKSEDFSFEELK